MKNISFWAKSLLLILLFGFTTQNTLAQTKNNKNFVFGKNAKSYHPTPSKSEQNMLYGTWCDKKTNEWIIGFFDKIAVYKNQSWKYKVVQQKKNKYTVELQKGNKKQTLFLTLKGKKKDKCKLKDGKTKRNLFYAPRPLPYNYPDTKPFANNGYKMDTVTINGYLQNHSNSNKPLQVFVSSLVKNKQDIYYTDIDKNGCFSIKIPILNTSTIFFNWNESSSLADVVEGGETYFLYVDDTGKFKKNTDNVIWQMGRNARLHREITDYSRSSKSLNYIRHYQGDIKNIDDLLNANRKIYKRNIKKLDVYIANNPNLSERFKSYVYNDKIVELGSTLMQNRFKLNKNKKERFSKEYEKYVRNLFAKMQTPYTISSYASGFLRDYIGYYANNLSIYSANAYDDLRETVNIINYEKLYSFSKEEEAILDKVSKLIDELEKDYKAGKDSVFLVKKATTYKKDFEDYSKILQKDDVKKAILKVSFYKLHKKGYDRLIAVVDTMPQNVKDIMLTREGLHRLKKGAEPLFQLEMDFLNKEIKNEHLKKILNDEQQKYIDLDGKSVEYVETLKLTNHLKDAKDADELLKKLTAPYLGKVIYLDFWGTWCGPCKREMKYVKDVKKTMKGKDIVFMYLANSSPEKAWKNVIKKYDITGKNVVHYNLPAEQQSMLERRLGVKGYPTFIIIDKKGNIVNMNPPYPSQGESLIYELNKWLKK